MYTAHPRPSSLTVRTSTFLLRCPGLKSSVGTPRGWGPRRWLTVCLTLRLVQWCQDKNTDVITQGARFLRYRLAVTSPPAPSTHTNLLILLLAVQKGQERRAIVRYWAGLLRVLGTAWRLEPSCIWWLSRVGCHFHGCVPFQITALMWSLFLRNVWSYENITYFKDRSALIFHVLYLQSYIQIVLQTEFKNCLCLGVTFLVPIFCAAVSSSVK